MHALRTRSGTVRIRCRLGGGCSATRRSIESGTTFAQTPIRNRIHHAARWSFFYLSPQERLAGVKGDEAEHTNSLSSLWVRKVSGMRFEKAWLQRISVVDSNATSGSGMNTCRAFRPLVAPAGCLGLMTGVRIAGANISQPAGRTMSWLTAQTR